MCVAADKDSGTELEDSVFTPGRGHSKSHGHGHTPTVDRLQYDDLMAEYLKLADAMTIIKKDLSHLQDLVSKHGQVIVNDMIFQKLKM